MKRNNKIRLTKSIVWSFLQKERIYGRQPVKELMFTPIIYKLPFWNPSENIKGFIYQNRIMVRFPQGGMCCMRLRGKAPLHKAFTLNEFINSFYMVLDEKTGNPYFKCYKK